MLDDAYKDASNIADLITRGAGLAPRGLCFGGWSEGVGTGGLPCVTGGLSLRHRGMSLRPDGIWMRLDKISGIIQQ